MKTMWMTVIAGAVMTVSGMAQDVTAKIPFGFQAQTAKLEAGAYKMVRVDMTSGVKSYSLRNVKTHKGVLTIASPMVAREDQRPHLKFECSAENDCALSEMWTGGPVGYRFSIPKRVGDAKPEVRIVEFTR